MCLRKLSYSLSFEVVVYMSLKVVVGSVYCMSHVLRVAARAMANVTSSYVAGTHSMAFVTVPDDQMARKLAK